MKSTKVQNPRRILHIIALCQYACAEIGHAPRCSCTRGAVEFSLQHGLAASVGTVLGKAECRWQSLGNLWRFAVRRVEKADRG